MATHQKNNSTHHPLVANRTAFMVIGCLEAAWAPLVPYVKSSFSLDEGTLGLLMLCSGLGSILSLPVSGWLCMKFGAKRVVYFSGFLMALALLTISLMVNVWLTAAMLIIFGGCTISIDVAANINGVAIEHQTGRHLMSGFHGGYSLGTLIGAGIMSALFTFGIVPAWAVTISMALTIAAMVIGCRGLLQKNDLKTANAPTASKPTEKKEALRAAHGNRRRAPLLHHVCRRGRGDGLVGNFCKRRTGSRHFSSRLLLHGICHNDDRNALSRRQDCRPNGTTARRGARRRLRLYWISADNTGAEHRHDRTGICSRGNGSGKYCSAANLIRVGGKRYGCAEHHQHRERAWLFGHTAWSRVDRFRRQALRVAHLICRHRRFRSCRSSRFRHRP